jgi:3-dehydrosphinganine reductase
VYILLAVVVFGLIRSKMNKKRYTLNLNGKHVFITGGSEGLGLAFAKKCHLNGANVTIVSRSEEKLKKAMAEIDFNGKNYFVLDVKESTVE